MTSPLDDAVAAVRVRRAALRKIMSEASVRMAPARLIDDAAALLDPDLSFLARLRRGVSRNKLLALAVVAGAAWLVGTSPQPDGKPSGARKVRRTKPKEKNNDSGQHKRDNRPEPGSGHRGKDPGSQGVEDLAQAVRRGTRRRGEARSDGGVETLGGEPGQPVGPAVRGPRQEPVEPVRNGQRQQPLAGEFVA